MMHRDLLPGLFKTEFSRITAVLCNYMGTPHIQAAEDIASETFLSALEVWPYKGIPENPAAWLYIVAKNKAKNYLHRSNVFSNKILEEVKYTMESNEEIIIDWSPKNISDSQLRMLFAICHPSIPVESQIGLALRILCGFGIEEIANAFLTNKETINKRLFRAWEKLRHETIDMELSPAAVISDRLDTVLTTLYLLYNEGYYSESQEEILRPDLCLEAMRLCHLLLENESTNHTSVHALFALMCFHSSRFPARKNANDEFVLYKDQDETLWNQELIAKGAYHLRQASHGSTLTKYHLEAGIAYWHTIKEDTSEKWESILLLYNHLLQVAYSPIAALNRIYALSKVHGSEIAITEAEILQLQDNHYYFTLLGQLYSAIDPAESLKHFQKAISLAKTEAEKMTVSRLVNKLLSGKESKQ